VPNKTPSAEDGPTTNIDVENNFIYVTTPGGGTGITVGTTGTGHKVYNNSVYYTGTGAFTCFSTQLAASNYENIDYNKCYTPNTNSAVWNTGKINVYESELKGVFRIQHFGCMESCYSLG
jgi:hypothetical protein